MGALEAVADIEFMKDLCQLSGRSAISKRNMARGENALRLVHSLKGKYDLSVTYYYYIACEVAVLSPKMAKARRAMSTFSSMNVALVTGRYCLLAHNASSISAS